MMVAAPKCSRGLVFAALATALQAVHNAGDAYIVVHPLHYDLSQDRNGFHYAISRRISPHRCPALGFSIRVDEARITVDNVEVDIPQFAEALSKILAMKGSPSAKAGS